MIFTFLFFALLAFNIQFLRASELFLIRATRSHPLVPRAKVSGEAATFGKYADG